MKYCSLCQTQYSDETMQFCLQDGTLLTSAAKQSTIDTIAFNNPLTIEKIQQTEEMRVQLPFQTQQRIESPQAENKKSLRMFWTIGLPILVVFGIAGLGSVFYLNKQNTADKVFASNTIDKKVSANTSSVETVADNPKQTQPAASENGEPKEEISEFINSWKKAFESRNLTEFTAKYAEKVDYLERNETELKEIRSEMQKIFTDYKEIELTLSNLHIAIDAEDDKATAIFDKEWSYESEKDLLEGKQHIKLQFEKIANDWKIVSEKVLKTYYVEN
jgi:ketosteroid isomerase-like protein